MTQTKVCKQRHRYNGLYHDGCLALPKVYAAAANSRPLGPHRRITALSPGLVQELAQRYRNLQTLSLARNSIPRIEHLAALSSVTALDLSHNRLTSIAGAEELPGLSALNVSANALRSFGE